MIHPLTETHVKILQLTAAGWTRKEIALELHYSLGSIKRMQADIRRVMGVPNRVAAVAEYVRQEMSA